LTRLQKHFKHSHPLKKAQYPISKLDQGIILGI
jgi:hypothetical protein